MNIFLRLLVGHVVGDFLLQTGRIAEMKRVEARGLLYHILLIAASTLLFLFPAPDWLPLLMAVVVIHLAIDSVRTFLLHDLNRWNTLYFLVDQTTHIVSLFLIASFSLSHRPDVTWGLLHPTSPLERVYLLLLALILLIFTVPVLEGLIAMDLKVQDAGRAPVITTRMRLLGALERVVGFAIMQTPYAFLVPMLFVPHYIYRFSRRGNGPLAYILARPTLSFVATTVIGWLVRSA